MHEPPSPSLQARVGLAVANALGGGLAAFAALGLHALGERFEPMTIALACVGGGCLLVGLPGSVVAHPGVRSLSRALAAVGIAVGGAATVILYAWAR